MYRYRIMACLLIGATLPIGCHQPTPRKNTANRGYQPQVAVQLYVFMQDRGRRKIDFNADLDNVLAEVAATGATAVEGFLDLYADPAQATRTNELLRKHHLRPAGLYSGGVFHDREQATLTIESICEKLTLALPAKCNYLDLNPDPLPGHAPKSDEQLAVQAEMVNTLGRRLKEMGIKLLLHQHAPALQQNARELRHLLAHTDSQVVGFCADTHWFQRGGQDPLVLLMELGRRTGALHLRNSQNGVWTESLGPGDVDYVAIAEYLRQIDFNGWLVLELAHEADTKITRPLPENIRRGLDYINKIFLKETI